MPLKKDLPLEKVQKLSFPLTCLKGVGPKRAALLAQKGLHTILDLMYFLPVRYEDRTRITPIKDTEEGVTSLVKGRVIKGREEKFYPSRKRLFKIDISDEGGRLELLWFRYSKAHLSIFTKPGTDLIVYGTVSIKKGRRQIIHPDVSLSEGRDSEKTLCFMPVYSSVKGISDNIIRSLIRAVMGAYMGYIIDPVPEEIRRRLDLPGLARSIETIHFPHKESSLENLNNSATLFHKRLLFDRFFYVLLNIAFRKRLREKISKPVSSIPNNLIEEINKFFKFSLTQDQRKAVNSIANDLSRGRPMSRLLMGDVGTGKTVVAAAAAYMTVLNNNQVAMMVPTQVLADQHMAFFSELPAKMGFSPVLLTGNMNRGEREEIYKKAEAGDYNLLIGTHSLIQEGISLPKLGLVIVDEQHRFGVRQRSLLEKKGDSPHVLVMTATPIPRTLSITLYGDMEISSIRERPEGHNRVRTYLVERSRKRWAFEKLREMMSAGQQAFVICPVIEESEQTDLKGAMEMEKGLRKLLSPPFRIGLIHGRMPSDEKERTMNEFQKGKIDLLVGTTLLEVGLHVPNATVMIIEHPERFGLAQIHQLRGRVGRGSKDGLCILMLSDDIPEKAASRLEVLAQSSDGFVIAQKDLELRGHGELTGTRQSGVGELDLFEMIKEPDLLLSAKNEAQSLVESDPDLSHPEHRYLNILMESISGASLDL